MPQTAQLSAQDEPGKEKAKEDHADDDDSGPHGDHLSLGEQATPSRGLLARASLPRWRRSRADLTKAKLDLAVHGLRTEAVGLALVGLGLLLQPVGRAGDVVPAHTGG